MGEWRCTFCGSLLPCGCRPGLYRQCEDCDKQAAEIERLRERDKHTVAIGELESWKLSQAGLQKENDQLRKALVVAHEILQHISDAGGLELMSRDGATAIVGRARKAVKKTRKALNQTDPGNSAG